eukprot:TRINITY_DN17753_c0_g1_i1.p1 TRINITY_DN17753_c0_g1~~TRINITY_DN17753_c0_g1_i1.p1  ORF type:complete len:894 (-),score=237.23 TRINITY_DN17753_c0_g1_i1:166-2847(-)
MHSRLRFITAAAGGFVAVCAHRAHAWRGILAFDLDNKLADDAERSEPTSESFQDASSFLGLGSGSRWTKPPTALLHTDHQDGNFPKQDAREAVELLRFVTAYRRPMDAFVDITPFSPLLRAAADTDQGLTFYAFIDTWVGNETTRKIINLDLSSGTCKEGSVTSGGDQGNGWQVHADLVFSPKETVDTRPRASLTLASGIFSVYGLGAISTHEGVLTEDGSAVVLTKPEDFNGRGLVEAAVYSCPGGSKELPTGVKLRQLLHEAQESGDSSGIDNWSEEYYMHTVLDKLLEIKMEPVHGKQGQFQATLPDGDAGVQVQKGDPIFLPSSDLRVKEGQELDFVEKPLTPVGFVIEKNGPAALLQMNVSCAVQPQQRAFVSGISLLESSRRLATSLQAAARKTIADKTQGGGMALSQLSAETTSTSDGDQAGQLRAPEWMPRLVELQEEKFVDKLPIALVQLEPNKTAPSMDRLSLSGQALRKAGEVKPIVLTQLASATASAKGENQQADSSKNAGHHVCVVARRSTSRVFDRDFNLPGIAEGERVILQFVATGHGWHESSEQCGEFCKMRYHLSVDGKPLKTVSLWRDDCGENPVGPEDGTWEISRNGWCPGSVEPGIYFDLTPVLTAGSSSHNVALDISVLDERSGEYQPYSNLGQEVGGDAANLFLGLTVFVYEADASKAILAQPQAYTAAEAAMRNGISNPGAVVEEEQKESPSVAAAEPEAGPAVAIAAAETQGATPMRYNYEKAAPWYMFALRPKAREDLSSFLEENTDDLDSAADSSQSADSYFKAKDNMHVEAFGKGGTLVQDRTRLQQGKVSVDQLPRSWGQVGLRLRLEQPSLLELDFWDRVGSVGILMPKAARKEAAGGAANAKTSDEAAGFSLGELQLKANSAE